MAQAPDLDQLPLKGVVLCCTSLTQDVRTKLADTAIQMGAIHKLDLTSDVTHLLVGNTATPKCRYVAKERPDVRVLFPGFIDAVRDSWVEGGVVNVEALETQWTIPPFHDLHICLTGFQDMEQRKEMENTIAANGGVYHADLTKRVTHLIAKQPEGAKYTHGKQWGIDVVGEKWYADSLVRGMALDEKLYLAELPLVEQGIGAFRGESKRTSLGKRARDGEQPADEESGRRKLRKAASTRLDAHSQELWRDASTTELQVETTELDAWTDESQTLRNDDMQRPSRVNQIVNTVGDETVRERPAGLFSGQYILIRGFEAVRTRKLRQFLEPNGACVVDSVDQLERASVDQDFQGRCLIIPHDQSIELPSLPPETVVVTEWWVERCIHFKRILHREEDPLSLPLAGVLVSGFEDLTISTTGLTGVDLRQTAEAVKLMGAKYEERLLASTSVLVCASSTVKKEKAFYASKHGTPVVSVQWLWTSLRTRRKASFEDYLMKLPAFELDESAGASSIAKLGSTGADSQFRRSGEGVSQADHYVPPKRLSNTRKRHAATSLTLKASKAETITADASRIGPFVVDNDDNVEAAPLTLPDIEASAAHDCLVLSPGPQKPLREISPNLSQKRSGHSSRALSQNVEPLKEPAKEHNLIPSPRSSPRASQSRPPSSSCERQPARMMHELTSDLAGILARRSASNSEVIADAPKKRKQRPLGRNLSGNLHRTISTSTSLSPAQPACAEEQNSAADGFYFSNQDETVRAPPSTQLGYETPEAAAQRIAGIGTVKDSADVAAQAKAAVGGRAKGRTRANKP